MALESMVDIIQLKRLKQRIAHRKYRLCRLDTAINVIVAGRQSTSIMAELRKDNTLWWNRNDNIVTILPLSRRCIKYYDMTRRKL